MRIVVTGGAGYIGSVMVPRLLNEGHEVTVLDNFHYAANSLATLSGVGKFDVHHVDVRNTESLRPFLKTADAVIPLAGLVGAPLCDLNPVDAELVNLRSQLAVFDMLSKDQLVIMPTTESMYGRNVTECTEETPLNPLSTYAKHKFEVEQALMARGNSTSLRLATAFGMSPRMRLDLLINDFTWRALKDRALVVFEAKYRRTCSHVIDISRAFIHALTLKPGEIYNVGTVTLSKWSLCEAIKKQVPGFYFVEAQFGTDPDGRDYVVSDKKIRATGFEPEIDLEKGISELLKGYRMLRNSVYGNV